MTLITMTARRRGPISPILVRDGGELPTLVLRSIVEPIGSNADGAIVLAAAIPWRKILRLLQEDPGFVKQLSPRQWEELIAASYVDAGFDEVTLTPQSGDLGRDVIAVKRGLVKVRIFDQVKAYAPGHLVTANDVRALLGVLNGNVSKGVMTTTSDFARGVHTDPSIQPMVPFRLELKNRAGLIDWIRQIDGEPPESVGF